MHLHDEITQLCRLVPLCRHHHESIRTKLNLTNSLNIQMQLFAAIETFLTLCVHMKLWNWLNTIKVSTKELLEVKFSLKDVVWKFLHSPAFISYPPTLIDSIRRATHPLLEFVLLNFQTACMSLWPLWLRNSNSDEDVCVWSVHAVCFGIYNINLMESIPPHSRKRAIRARTISKEEPTRHLLFRPIHLTSIELVLERKRRRNCHGVGGIKPHSGMIGKRSIAIRSVRSYSV